MASAICLDELCPQERNKFVSLGAINDGRCPTCRFGNILRILGTPVDVLDQSTIADCVINIVSKVIGRRQNLLGLNKYI